LQDKKWYAILQYGFKQKLGFSPYNSGS